MTTSPESWPERPSDLGRSVLRGLAWRISATVGLIVGGFVFVLLYLAFLAARFSWYQNVAVVLSVGAIVPSAVVLLWIAWGIGLGRRLGRAADW